jgi:hypothetical protein
MFDDNSLQLAAAHRLPHFNCCAAHSLRDKIALAAAANLLGGLISRNKTENGSKKNQRRPRKVTVRRCGFTGTRRTTRTKKHNA